MSLQIESLFKYLFVVSFCCFFITNPIDSSYSQKEGVLKPKQVIIENRSVDSLRERFKELIDSTTEKRKERDLISQKLIKQDKELDALYRKIQKWAKRNNREILITSPLKTGEVGFSAADTVEPLNRQILLNIKTKKNGKVKKSR